MNCPGRRIQPSATIAELIQIILDREIGFSMEIFRYFQIGLSRGMDAQQENDGTSVKEPECDVVTDSN
jgi:hypothetical protein